MTGAATWEQIIFLVGLLGVVIMGTGTLVFFVARWMINQQQAMHNANIDQREEDRKQRDADRKEQSELRHEMRSHYDQRFETLTERLTDMQVSAAGFKAIIGMYERGQSKLEDKIEGLRLERRGDMIDLHRRLGRIQARLGDEDETGTSGLIHAPD